jgi:signal transduction histidine kinase
VAALVVTMADSVVTMHLLFKPLETTVFLLIALGASLIFTSRLWFHLTLAANAAAWGLGVAISHPGPMLSPGAPWVELGITLAAATVVAELVFLTRRRIYWRIEGMRLAEARQRQELETAMAALQAQHEQLQALMRFKTDFVNAVSHDLRIPLTSIKGFTELLVDRFAGPLTGQQEAYVSQIEKNAARLERLVHDMLDFAKLEAGTFKLKYHELDFGSLATELVESFKPQAQDAHLTLTLELPQEPLIVAMDAERIERVVANLISNAVKFTPAAGRIRIRAWLDETQLTCEIEDSGVGIAPDELPRLFQRFSQLEHGRRARGGTGLGLSISKAIVEAHGGQIGVRSEFGTGSVFWFTLPRRPVPVDTGQG